MNDMDDVMNRLEELSDQVKEFEVAQETHRFWIYIGMVAVFIVWLI